MGVYAACSVRAALVNMNPMGQDEGEIVHNIHANSTELGPCTRAKAIDAAC